MHAVAHRYTSLRAHTRTTTPSYSLRNTRIVYRCRFSYFKVMKDSGNVFSGVWEEEHIRTNASSHPWIPIIQLQMEVPSAFQSQ